MAVSSVSERRFGPRRHLPNLTLCILVLASATVNFALPALAQSQLAERPRRPLHASVTLHDLSASTKELAEQLEIMPMIEELFDRSRADTREKRDRLRGKIMETIMEAHFDAESVQAEAERELSRLMALRQIALDKRDRGIMLNNATNFIASGTLNTVGSVLGFSAKWQPFPGNFNQMMSGIVATAMSSYSLWQQRGGKMRGQGHPTLLADLYGRPTDEQTTYPESVWRFFHGKVPGHPELTRAQLLEKNWISGHQLEKHGSARETIKIDLVCGAEETRRIATIDDLNDQINMIDDIGMEAGLMDHHLRDLMNLIDSDNVEPAD